MVGYDRILEALRREADKRPELTAILAFHCDLLTVQAQTNVSPCLLALDAAQAAERLQQGDSLLTPDTFEVDAEALIGLCLQIGFTTAQHRRELVRPLGRIHAWLHERRHLIGALAREHLREGRVYEGEDAGLRGDLLAFIFNNALRPFLRVTAEALSQWVDDGAWYRGHCPVCHGEPDFAALEKERGTRRLLCSRCDMEWSFPRAGCPFCSEETRGGYYPGDNKAYRLYVCDACQRYLKTLDRREAADERLLPTERILTIGMDIAAREAGYHQGG